MNGLQYKINAKLQRHSRLTDQKKLGHYLGLSKSATSRMINNPSRKLKQETFDKLLSFLEIERFALEAILEADAMTIEQLKEENTEMDDKMRYQSYQIAELTGRLLEIETQLLLNAKKKAPSQ